MRLVIFCFGFALLASSCQTSSSRLTPAIYDSTKGLLSVSAQDTTMNLAISEARRHLDQFRQALLLHPPGIRLFSLKVKFPIPTGHEHIWISQIRYQQGNYKGIIDNVPVSITEIHNGDPIIVDPQQITDWMYVEDNRIRGGYTIRAARLKLSGEAARKLDQDIGLPFWDL